MSDSGSPFLPSVLLGSTSSNDTGRLNLDTKGNHGSSFQSTKKRGHGSHSWIKIDKDGNSEILELDKATIMRHCSLPARDLWLLDPLFIYSSTILGQEKAIVVSLVQIRSIITADEVILMNPWMDVSFSTTWNCANTFRPIRIKLIKELDIEIYPVLDELASSISTLNLKNVCRLKGHLLTLAQRVQKVLDEIEHLVDDDGDMAEMYLQRRNKGWKLTLQAMYIVRVIFLVGTE